MNSAHGARVEGMNDTPNEKTHAQSHSSADSATATDTAAAKADLYEAGIQVRREVMGNDFVDAALQRNAGSDGEELQKHITATVWGSVWTREGLSRRDRSLLNIGMLVALRATEELRGHVKGGLANGLTREEITEAVIHTSGYCGAPAALSAMKVVQDVLVSELGPKDSEESSESPDSPVGSAE